MTASAGAVIEIGIDDPDCQPRRLPLRIRGRAPPLCRPRIRSTEAGPRRHAESARERHAQPTAPGDRAEVEAESADGNGSGREGLRPGCSRAPRAVAAASPGAGPLTSRPSALAGQLAHLRFLGDRLFTQAGATGSPRAAERVAIDNDERPRTLEAKPRAHSPTCHPQGTSITSSRHSNGHRVGQPIAYR